MGAAGGTDAVAGDGSALDGTAPATGLWVAGAGTPEDVGSRTNQVVVEAITIASAATRTSRPARRFWRRPGAAAMDTGTAAGRGSGRVAAPAGASGLAAGSVTCAS